MAPPVPTMLSRLTVEPAQVPPASGTRAVAQVLGQGAGALDQIGSRITAILEEKRNQADAIGLSRDFAATTNVASTEFRRVQTEEDISDPGTVMRYAEFLDRLYGEAVQTHAGSEASRARLAARLEDDRGRRIDQLSIASLNVGRALVREEFGTTVASLAARAGDDPASILDMLQGVEDAVTDMAPAFGEAEVAEARRMAQAQVVTSAVTGLLDRGAYDFAEQVMVERPEVARVLDPDVYRRLRSRISEARQAETAEERRIAALEARVGPLSRAEMLALYGVSPGAPEALEVIADPSSPTGLRHVTRSQAAGQPAPPQRPLVEMGPQVGTIPPGYQLSRGPDGEMRMEAIPGGPADLERRHLEQTEAARGDMTSRRAKTVVRDIDRSLALLRDSSIPAAGPIAGSLPVPGTPAFALQHQLDSIGANISIDELQRMRESSPTGGALGQIPVAQQRILMSVLGSLDIRQPKEFLVENLNQIRELYLDAWFGTPEEHQRAVADGRMAPEEARRLQHERETVGFDAIGRPRLDPATDAALQRQAAADGRRAPQPGPAETPREGLDLPVIGSREAYDQFRAANPVGTRFIWGPDSQVMELTGEEEEGAGETVEPAQAGPLTIETPAAGASAEDPRASYLYIALPADPPTAAGRLRELSDEDLARLTVTDKRYTARQRIMIEQEKARRLLERGG